MRPTHKLASAAVMSSLASSAFAGGSPGGVATWIVFGGGVGTGLGLGLLWCWLRCRANQKNGRTTTDTHNS